MKSVARSIRNGRARGAMMKIDCPRCGAKLVLHQPDMRLADRLLGTCEACKSWYILDSRLRVVTEVLLPRETGRPEAGRSAD